MKLVYAIVNSDDTYAVNKRTSESRHKSHKAFFNRRLSYVRKHHFFLSAALMSR